MGSASDPAFKCPVGQFSLCYFGSVPRLEGADRLVALGFRHWLDGYRTGEVEHWTTCWDVYERDVGTDAARVVVGELSGWVRTVAWAAKRDIQVMPSHCRSFCRDECAAVALIAAMQHEACPAFRACTAALLATDACDEVLDSARSFAVSLRNAGQVLSLDLLSHPTGRTGGAAAIRH